ncbi:hypothetical protein [Tepidibacter mesophilus]|uniref:hypothetical protein n=1 Tax=Tepidibacter mesophilus TaxID=655607 RepID=UPI000C08D0EC|nr:hypothetical protein [Tepidibacter mesophilus]
MEIIDSKGMYTILVDKRRRIVYEKNIGVWTSEDLNRFLDDYKNIVFNILGNDKPWSKFCNLSQYQVSNIYNELIEFLKILTNDGLKHCTMVCDDPIVTAQMHELCKQVNLNYAFFSGVNAFEDAFNWLESMGYKFKKTHYV